MTKSTTLAAQIEAAADGYAPVRTSSMLSRLERDAFKAGANFAALRVLEGPEVSDVLKYMYHTHNCHWPVELSDECTCGHDTALANLGRLIDELRGQK